MTDPVTNCPHAGPAGDVISANPAACSGGDVCISFCTLEVQACGSQDSPLPGDPTGAGDNEIFEYPNVAQCVEFCPRIGLAHPYSTTSVGNSLACRLNEAVKAAVSVPDAIAHCFATSINAKNACAGTAMP